FSDLLRPPPVSPLSPYTTLFRSLRACRARDPARTDRSRSRAPTSPGALPTPVASVSARRAPRLPSRSPQSEKRATTSRAARECDTRPRTSARTTPRTPPAPQPTRQVLSRVHCPAAPITDSLPRSRSQAEQSVLSAPPLGCWPAVQSDSRDGSSTTAAGAYRAGLWRKAERPPKDAARRGMGE